MSQQKPDHEPHVVKHTDDSSPDEALKYWTAEKKRKAKPAPMPHIHEIEQARPAAPHPSQAPDPHKS
ncbi:MAG TPA: hypothetical protein VGD98_26045 [Ktedonobacteraceae bacterium]